MTEKRELTIVEMTANNVTNLKAVRIKPDGNLVILTGANEAGKSNILDVIQTMLEGLRIKMPIREGEERADATIDLGDIKIRKRWTAKGEGLEVYEIVDGKKRIFTSPREFLDGLTGKMVDPMKLYFLMKNDPKKFRNTLADLVGLDLTDLNDEEATVRDERKLVNDKIRDAIAQLKEMTAPDPSTPTEERTFKEKLDAVNRLREKQKVFVDAMIERQDIKSAMLDSEKRMSDYHNEIEELQKKIRIEVGIYKENSEEFDKYVIPDEVTNEQITAAEAEIEQLEEQNVKIRQAKRYNQQVKQSKIYQKESDEFSQKLNRIEQDKQTRISSCKFPVDALSLSQDQVFYKGKPLEIASSGRQIRVFAKMAIAMSPEIKVILIRDGSLLDNKGLQELCKIAEEVPEGEQPYQIWMEKCDDSGKVGIFIENGEIRAIDGKNIDSELPNDVMTGDAEMVKEGEY